jgi:hypothetical protein
VTRLRIRDKRSRSRARDMLAAQVRYGQGQATAWQEYDLRTMEGVKQLLADRGHPDFDRLVEEVRPKDAVLPLETHLGFQGWGINLPPGGSYAAVLQGGKELARITGESGRFVTSEYQERFTYSVRCLKRCTNGEDAEYGDVLACFSAGLSSIEAFVNYRTKLHRHKLPRGNEPDKNISLDFKLDNWIPPLSAGNPINKSEKYWQDFRKIRDIRNERESHPKDIVYGVSGSTFIRELNLWRTGIATMLLALHAITRRLAPPELVKHAYLPDIELVPR